MQHFVILGEKTKKRGIDKNYVLCIKSRKSRASMRKKISVGG